MSTPRALGALLVVAGCLLGALGCPTFAPHSAYGLNDLRQGTAPAPSVSAIGKDVVLLLESSRTMADHGRCASFRSFPVDSELRGSVELTLHSGIHGTTPQVRMLNRQPGRFTFCWPDDGVPFDNAEVHIPQLCLGNRCEHLVVLIPFLESWSTSPEGAAELPDGSAPDGDAPPL